ncbi:MAG: carboxylesterase family protein [Asticcacaulis sp.]|uniref:carboxylesterase/lipase family protein n=1 Tax=Asticcacaulis sp. TaxID=1872648 RepID=UPI0039E63D77
MWSRRSALSGGMAAAAAFGLGRLALAQGVPRSTVTTGPDVEVEIADGRLRGGHSRGALAFKGIPYAGPVSGAGRFREAPPVVPWIGVRDATRLGPPSLQKAKSTYGEQEPAYAEDCLVLNVWTPAVNDDKRRPVLFYCHGGGFATGSAGSTAQDGARLAALYDVVVVATNHRLGLLGYLYLGEIGGANWATSGNQGMLDIVAGLRWVKANIASFGGNPDNVTLFGESGGGFKVGTLLAMPAAKGLFHKASIQSGAALTRMPKAMATETALRVLKGLGIAPNELHKLAEVPAEQILAVQLAGEQGQGALTLPSDGSAPVGRDGRLHKAGFWLPGSYGPVVDGTVLPADPFDPVASPLMNDVPLIVGHNRDEATFFNMGRPDTFKLDEAGLKARLAVEFAGDAEKLFNVYRATYPKATPSELYIAIASARWFGADSATTADRKSLQPAPVYRYHYDYESNFPIPGTAATLKAGHATEIASLFANTDQPGLEGNGPGLEEASTHMSAFWANFARTGKPSAPGQPDWPRYTTKDRPVMRISSICQVENDPEAAARRIWQEEVAD